MTAPLNNATSNTQSVSQEQPWLIPDTPIRLRTKLMFAVVTALGGMVIGTGEETGALAVIVVFFAIIGFICVDWQKLFSVPPIVAYAAMALTAVVCVADFVQQADLLGRKMIAVAQLLAVAQAILMLQEKSQRLFEQLLVFALLNCVVAAVFNDAFNYAIWFLPLTIASGLALAFLAADQTLESANPNDSAEAYFAWDNACAIRSLKSVSLGIPWISLLVLLPAVALFASTFFFALPRRVDPQRGSPGKSLVGFSGQVELGQISRMQMTNERALRVRLTDPKNMRAYPVFDGLYLRGLTLEKYVSDREVADGGGSWQSVDHSSTATSKVLPVRHTPERPADANFFDRVHVRVTTESMRTPALFSIAPYHRIVGGESLVHHSLQWVIGRRKGTSTDTGAWYPRIEYQFGTHAFRNGIQTPWISHRYAFETNRSETNRSEISTSNDNEASGKTPSELKMTPLELNYLDQLLDFPEQNLPSARPLADEIVQSIPTDQRDPVKISRAMESHFASSGRYQYTLNLDDPPQVGVDPIEQFLSSSRRGHCQYFASALVLMLRSQKIPARLVVGYHCDEFNDLGQSYIVRQRHAHAWAEALIPRDAIPIGESIYGQPESNHYWLRLDPTPGGGLQASTQTGTSQIVDLAQNFWNEQVIEMNNDHQQMVLSSTPGFNPMTQSYKTWIEKAQSLAIRINAGEVKGLGGGRLFSLPAAFATIGFSFFLIVIFKVPIFGWFRTRWVGAKTSLVPRPSLAFYAETLEILERVDVSRKTGQTPAELADSVTQPRLREPVHHLTQWFYRLRYGPEKVTVSEGTNAEIESSLQLLRDRIKIKSR